MPGTPYTKSPGTAPAMRRRSGNLRLRERAIGGIVWARQDLNLHAVASASPSSWCVCQFHHEPANHTVNVSIAIPATPATIPTLTTVPRANRVNRGNVTCQNGLEARPRGLSIFVKGPSCLRNLFHSMVVNRSPLIRTSRSSDDRRNTVIWCSTARASRRSIASLPRPTGCSSSATSTARTERRSTVSESSAGRYCRATNWPSRARNFGFTWGPVRPLRSNLRAGRTEELDASTPEPEQFGEREGVNERLPEDLVE